MRRGEAGRHLIVEPLRVDAPRPVDPEAPLPEISTHEFACGLRGEGGEYDARKAGCGECLLSAEALVDQGFAAYEPGAGLRILRLHRPFAPPGDWWVCRCDGEAQPPNPDVLFVDRNQCRRCRFPQGVLRGVEYELLAIDEVAPFDWRQ